MADTSLPADAAAGPVASNHSRELREFVPLVENPRPYQPSPQPEGANPYLSLRHVLHELFWLAAVARMGQDVSKYINPTTDLWDGAESRARADSAGWGIPFTTFDPILTEAKREMRELAQVAAGNTSVPFAATDSRYALLEERLQELAHAAPDSAADPARAGADELGQRFRCYNCQPPHEFSSAVPLCPQCGADATKPEGQGYVQPLVTTHFDPPHPVLRERGQRVKACTGSSWLAGEIVSGVTLVVTCPACRETDAFKAAFLKQYPDDATECGRKRVDELVSKITVDPPRGLDPELADAFSAIAVGIRECTRLMASVPHLWRDEGEYRRLAASVAAAASAAHTAYMAVDIRLRRAGGPNQMLDTLNDVLTVKNRAPLDPIGTTDGLNEILTNLHMRRAELFPRVDGRGCIDRMLDQLACVPPATNSAPFVIDPLAGMSAAAELEALDPIDRQRLEGLRVRLAQLPEEIETVSRHRDWLAGWDYRSNEHVESLLAVWHATGAKLPRFEALREELHSVIVFQTEHGPHSRPVSHFTGYSPWTVQQIENLTADLIELCKAFATAAARSRGIIGNGAQLTDAAIRELEVIVRTPTPNKGDAPPPPFAATSAPNVVGSAPPAETPTMVPAKSKRSTERGDGWKKLVAALSEHHKYADGGCLNLEPIGNNKLARAARVSGSTASHFFMKAFRGWTKYRIVCRNGGRLTDSLKALNDEFAPHDLYLYGRRPSDEDDRNDEEE